MEWDGFSGYETKLGQLTEGGFSFRNRQEASSMANVCIMELMWLLYGNFSDQCW